MIGGISAMAETQAQRDQRRYSEQWLMKQQYNAPPQMAGLGSVLGGSGLQNAQRQQAAYRPPEKSAPKSIVGELQESVDKWLADVKI